MRNQHVHARTASVLHVRSPFSSSSVFALFPLSFRFFVSLRAFDTWHACSPSLLLSNSTNWCTETERERERKEGRGWRRSLPKTGHFSVCTHARTHVRVCVRGRKSKRFSLGHTRHDGCVPVPQGDAHPLATFCRLNVLRRRGGPRSAAGACATPTPAPRKYRVLSCAFPLSLAPLPTLT